MLTTLIFLVGSTWDAFSYGGVLMGMLLMVAVGMVLRGVNGQPIRLLNFIADTQTLTLRVYSAATVEALLSAPEARTGIYKTVRPWYLIALVVTVGVALVAGFISLKTRQ